MLRSGLSINAAIVLFGLLVSAAMLLVMLLHRKNQAREDSLHSIGMEKQRGDGYRESTSRER
jgi:hypothetical protein